MSSLRSEPITPGINKGGFLSEAAHENKNENKKMIS